MKISYIKALGELFFQQVKKIAKELKPSAGILFICPADRSALLTQRGVFMSSPGALDIPGGRGEGGDASQLETALREAREELGSLPQEKKLITKHVLNTPEGDNQYVIFVYAISINQKNQWTPTISLDFESQRAGWVPIDQIPSTGMHLNLDWIKNLPI